MESTLTLKRTKGGLVLAVLAALGAITYFAFYIAFYSSYPADDAFIHLRIARHFAENGVPYYNLGERVNGSSSLLWTVLLSTLFKLFGVSTTLLPLLEWLLAVGCFALCALLLRERYSWPISVAAAFVVITVFLLNTASLWMETPAAIFFFLLSVLFLRRETSLWAGFFAGLAFLTRLEFGLWLLIAFFACTGISKKKSYLCGAAFPLLFFVVYNSYYFGSLIPNTVFAKSKIYPIEQSHFWYLFGIHQWLGFALFFACFIQLLLLRKQKAAPWLVALSLFSIALPVLYFVKKTYMFPWYMPLILCPMSLVFLLATSLKRLPLSVCYILSTTMFFVLALKEAVGLVQNRPSRHRDYLACERVRQYQRIGKTLYRQFPNATLMTSEIGGLGWTFEGKIADGAGLVSPQFLKYQPVPVPLNRGDHALGAIPPDAVREAKPDLIVSMDIFSEAFRRDLKRRQFPEYKLWRSYPAVEIDGVAPILRVSVSTEVYIHQRLQIQNSP